MNKIAAFYARVSTGRQEKEETIESQIAEIKEKIQKDCNILGETFQFIDEGWSGELMERPGLDAMRDSAMKNEFAVLYVYDRGRLSRKFAYQEVIIEELQDKRIDFITLHDVNAATPEEHVLQAMQGVLHEYERIKIAERMRRGKLYKAKSGNIVHGINKFGWTYVYKTKEKDCHYIINDKQVEIVRKIFHLIADEGFTIRQLIRRLYELQIPSPEENKKWSNSTLSRILRDEAYIGTTYYNRRYCVLPKNPQKNERYKKHKRSSRAFRSRDEWIPIPIPPILEKELFGKVQKQLEINALYSRRNKKHEYLLSHKIWCECGSRMFGEGSGTQFYYRCTDRLKTYPLPTKCDGCGLNIKRIESGVWGNLQKLLNNPELIEQQAKDWLLKESSSPQLTSIKTKEMIQKGLEEVENQEKRYIKAYGEGLIPIEALKSQMEGVKNRRSELLNKMQAISTIDSFKKPMLPSLDEIKQRLPKLLQKLSTEDKQTIIRLLIKEIIVNKPRTSATIRGYLPIFIQDQDSVKNPKCGYESISRYRRIAQRWKVYSI